MMDMTSVESSSLLTKNCYPASLLCDSFIRKLCMRGRCRRGKVQKISKIREISFNGGRPRFFRAIRNKSRMECTDIEERLPVLKGGRVYGGTVYGQRRRGGFGVGMEWDLER